MARFPAPLRPASPTGGGRHHRQVRRDCVGTRFGLSGLIRLALLATLGIVVLTGCATMARDPAKVAATCPGAGS